MNERKKILFISPARPRNPGEDFVFKMSFLNLPYIAAATPPEYEVRIIDEEYEEIDFESKPWLVALSAQTPVAPRAYEVARLFREKGVKTVMGGVHASTLPQEALQYVDAVIIGEGEFVWKDVLSDLENGTLKDIYDGGSDHELKGTSLPRRDLLNPRFYIPLTMVETTRGCPHQCDFCGVSKFFGHRYRKRPLNEVVAELREEFQPGFRHGFTRLLAKLGWDLPYFIERRLIYFIDSNFAADRNYTYSLMETLEELNVLWWAHTTVDIARDEEFLRKMSRSGCIAVNIGFESLSSENLKIMHKSFAGNYDYAQAVKRIHDHGIGIMGTFVVGFDNEDKSIFKKTYDFIMENKLDWALVFIRTPYPGTDLFEELERTGRIITRDWEKYDTLNCVFSPRGMSIDDLENGLKETWKKIFAFRSIWIRILKRPRVHPLFYFSMNMQFFNMVRKWEGAADDALM
jgi:radical SAM superfamily enzyme YgiQ (UPF0313 family)